MFAESTIYRGPVRPGLTQRSLGPPGLTRRGLIGLGILGAHAGVIALFALGIYTPQARPELAPVTVDFLEEQPAKPVAPSPAEPELVALTPPAVTAPDVPLLDEAVQVEVPTQTPASPALAPAVSTNSSGATTVPELSEVAYLEPPVPRYPPESKHAREEGRVILRVLIDEAGRASSVSIYRSSGHPRLDEAACTAVQRAVFKPYLDGGIARAAVALVPVEFSLHGVGDRGRRSG